MTLEVADRTDISTVRQITFCNSPIHIRAQNLAQNSSITKVILYLWIWNGAQNKVLGNPNYTLKKDKISNSDNYINFQISDLVKAFLITPDNALNTNQPTFVYNQASNPSITGQGVFWQLKADIYSGESLEVFTGETKFSTLGYRWNYEQNIIGNNGIDPNGNTGFIRTVNKWYNPKIHNYISQSFNLSTTVATGTTANLISVESVTPPSGWKRCSKDPALIVFLNKLGLWEMFTPHGKISTDTKLDSDTVNLGFRDPSKIDNTYTHSKGRLNLDVTQSYTVNTGLLDETMCDTVEQILYSPKVYFIKFKGDIITDEFIGITIDSTIITIDSTIVTIDSDVVGAEDVGFYFTHEQVPVIVTNSSFNLKSRINDKNSIEYNIQLEETNSKLLDIR